MPDRVLDLDPLGTRPTREEYLQRVRYRSLVCTEVVPRVARILRHFHALPQSVEAGVGRGFVLVIVGREIAAEEAHGDRVLEAVVAIGSVAQRTALVDD